MILAFTITFPNVNTWTNKDKMYCKMVNIGRSKSSIEKAENILKKGYFTYNFSDGWTARVNVKRIDAKEAAKIKRKSRGFLGYDWMIDSIIKNNDIIELTPPTD